MAKVIKEEPLTPKEEMELLKLLEDDAKNKLEYYNKGDKVHKIQMDFHADRHRNRWMLSGNRTGKTVAGAVEAIWRARGNHPFVKIMKPTKGWVVSVTNEVQRDVAQKEILKWLNPDWIVSIHVRAGKQDDPENAIIDFIIVKSICGGNSEIGFKSCDQGRSKFQGTSRDWVWFDEEPPKEIYDECRMRIIDTRGEIWGTMTPLMGLTWVYNSIFINEVDDPNIKYWNMQWSDNPWLSKEEVAELEATMTEEEREARQYGRFVALSGLIYKEFNENIHVIDPFDIPKGWYDKISIDTGFRNPLSCHFYAVDEEGTVYVIAEHYEKERLIEYHSQKILSMADKLGWPRNKFGKLKCLIDSAALKRSEMTAKSTVNLFSEYGIICNPKVDKSVWVGIQRVKNYLKLRVTDQVEKYLKGKPSIFIFRTCSNMIKEFKSYRWDDTETDLSEKEKPKKVNDHALDELRYYIMSKPDPFRADSVDSRFKIGGSYYRTELFMYGLNKNEIDRYEKNGDITILGD